jgi:hypothetical protein
MPLPGMPPVTDPADIYADAGADMLSPAVRGVPSRIYVPDSTIIQAGHANIFAPCNGTSACGEYVVQPEMGKLLIAVGEWLFGLNSFGWRFASAVSGSLAILLMCRIARRMTRSTLLGCIAGLLMSLDGLEFVLSRTGILDIFLRFFVLAAFGCVLVDRDISRERLAEKVAGHPGGAQGSGPRLGIRRLRVAAGVFDQLCAHARHAYDRIIGLDLSEVAIDGSLHKAPCGGEGTGPNPTDRGNSGGSGRSPPMPPASPSGGQSTEPTATT